MSEVVAMTGQVVPLKAGGRVRPIIPETVEEVFRIAKAIAASGLAPNGLKSAEQITIAIMHGAEIGLPPMQAIQRIAVVNGRPTIWGDAIPALLLSRGFKLEESIDGTDDGRGATCTVTRPDGTKVMRRFSIGDAKAALLWGKAGPWKQYPERMLQMRARGYAARDGAADVLAGLYISEEVLDLDVPAKRKSSAEGKRDGTTERFNELRRQIAEATTLDALATIEADNKAEIDTMPPRWAEMVADDIWARRKDLGLDDDPAVTLRMIERDIDRGIPAADVHDRFREAIMAMGDDDRASALEMIESAKAQS